jgi:hypothetical protein
MRTILLITFLFFSNYIHSQSSYLIKKEFQVQEIFYCNDDAVFIISENTLYKFDLKGNLLSKWVPSQNETITSIDARNPFKILVNYGLQNSVLFLDINLTQLIDKSSPDIFQNLGDYLLTVSNLGGYFIWDEKQLELLKLNSDFILEFTYAFDFDASIKQLLNIQSLILFRTEIGNIYITDLSKSKIIEARLKSTNPIFIYRDQFSFFKTESQSFFVFKDGAFRKLNLSNSHNLSVQMKNAVIAGDVIVGFDDEFLYFFGLKKV